MADNKVIEGQPAKIDGQPVKIDGPPKSKTGDKREQEALNQVWNAKQTLKTIRDEQRIARTKMRVHEAVSRFLILRYIIRKLKDNNELPKTARGLLIDVKEGLKSHEGYDETKVASDKNSLDEIVSQYHKKQ